MKPSLDYLRESNGGKLPSFAWPGGYRILYLLENGDSLCGDCANIPEDGRSAWGSMVGHFVNWEGPPEQCVECNREFPSEYGDPDNPEDESEASE